MKKFVYELHMHTVESSKCGVSTGAEHVRRYAALGYAGVIVTDHFFNGNSTVPRELPWDERIRLFTTGFNHAKEEGDRLGLSVWFGYEFHYDWNHFLTYGITPQTLEKNPQIMEMPLGEYVGWVRSEGGYVVHAHPFRTPGSEQIQLARNVDAVEILNANRSDGENDLARRYAELFGIAAVYGSDCHSVLQKRLGAVTSDVRFETVDEMFAAILEAKTENAVVTDPNLN
ncbi:MAG: PHP domain-containing protein [Clostridia bacterium]|nr:PHP domain-containing protein [Clostridia bacterium]